MKTAILTSILTLFFGIGSLTAQVYDDVYDSSKPVTTPTTYTKEEQENENMVTDKSSDKYSFSQENSRNSYDDDQYIDYDNDDYYYTSRIRRFNNSFWRFGYYSPFYMDPFWWDMSYGYPSFSIGWGYPNWYNNNSFYGNNWGYGNNWNNWNNWGNNGGWSYGGCFNSWNNYNYGNYGGCFGYGNYGWGNNFGNGYNNGYNHGYSNGYWDGFNNNNNGYGLGSGYVYGPRSSVNSSIRYNRNSIRNTNELLSTDGRRTMPTRANTQSPVPDGSRVIRNNATQYQNTNSPSSTIRSNEMRNERNIRSEESTSDRSGATQAEPIPIRSRQPYQNRLDNEQRQQKQMEQQRHDESNRSRMQQEQGSDQQRSREQNRDQRDARMQNQRQERMNRDRSEREQRTNQQSQQREERRNQSRNEIPAREQRSAPAPRYEAPQRQQRTESPRMESPRMQAPSNSNMGGGRRR